MNPHQFNQSFGKANPSLQQYDSIADDVESLRASLTRDPLSNWNSATSAAKAEVDPHNIQTWFPSDDGVAFYLPHGGGNTISYAQLHDEIGKCPRFSNGQVVVAILLPPEHMAEMAVVLLSVMANGGVAAPLDPHMTPIRTLEAMEQLQCQSIVSTEELLRHIHLWDDESSSTTTTPFASKDSTDDNDDVVDCLSSVAKRLTEIRTIGTQKIGHVEWSIYEKKTESDASEVQWIQVTDTHVGTNGPVDSTTTSDRPVLLLRTSGTTSTPKVVPLKAPMLLYNAICIAASLGLTRDDVDCNAMPLYHIGGIACALLAVLVSGSATLMAGPFVDPNAFLDLIAGTSASSSSERRQQQSVMPTWYYGVPTIHKSLLLTAARLNRENEMAHTNLRLVRSGAAHLSHDVALELSKLFRTNVLPTYSMSECMPVCSCSTPIVYEDASVNENDAVVDTVGPSIGPSVRIIDSDSGSPLPYGSVGEIALRGPGVMDAYLGIETSTSHTTDGWFKTGDVGTMDSQGRIFLKGRTKEMIKRGGEQVWPNEIDDVVEKVEGVSTAVSFGIPNELWGEEVAVAVVLKESLGEQTASLQVSVHDKIMAACHDNLDEASIPRQIIFLNSTEQLPKGPTGKYLRTKMASHLNVVAVDTGALQAMQLGTSPPAAEQRAMDAKPRAAPSSALNGIRFVVACFVVMLHVGLYPNTGWLKVQTYSLNMTIFFALAGYQLTCAVAKSVKGEWANFVGTKIGSMHALFVIVQFIALPAYLLFSCSDSCSPDELTQTLLLWVFATATGLLGRFNVVNAVTWFQTVIYFFLLLYPWLDHLLRRQTRRVKCWLMVGFGLIATVVFVFVFGLTQLIELNFTIVSWFPLLLTAMLMAYFFPGAVKRCHRRLDSTHADTGRSSSADKIEGGRMWGVIADVMSVVLLLFEVIVITSNDCLCVMEASLAYMRPNEAIPEEECFAFGETVYVTVCDVTYDEFVDFIHANPYDYLNNGRWRTEVGGLIGFARIATPVVLLWIFALSFGHGLTASMMRTKVMAMLSPLAYPLYLLHGPIARYYWMATRGLEPQFWFDRALLYPFPVQWWELFIIIAICLIVGFLFDRFLIPRLMPHTVRLGVRICKALSCCFSCGRKREVANEASTASTTFEQVEGMVKTLTGAEVTPSTDLRHLGLDSLGATALLSALRVNVPAAKDLTMQQLAQFRTVGDLVDFLDDPTVNDSSLRSRDLPV